MDSLSHGSGKDGLMTDTITRLPFRARVDVPHLSALVLCEAGEMALITSFPLLLGELHSAGAHCQNAPRCARR